ncbi:hypothetical protein ALC56_05672 [Trachymyrmex septentrionalis]|uniref:Uncharacterized protein n=1 Tax=Trachymyrmex septentrionalis TaxID=34720 RepID=A0A195FIU1_9HYME|nr:hypothetical protein ALC56_05672 [Trachymyrmex septentrionalis]
MFNEAVKSRGGKMAAAVTLQVPFGSCTRKARDQHRNMLLRDISNLIPQIFVFIGCLILCSRSIFCHGHIREDLLCVDERKIYCCKERERAARSARLSSLPVAASGACEEHVKLRRGKLKQKGLDISYETIRTYLKANNMNSTTLLLDLL